MELDIERKWYAIYTMPRWEKKVAKLLNDNQLEAYCPLNVTIKQWSDRKKKVEEPLFKSYVFVRVSDKEQLAVKETTGVLNFVYWLRKPAVIKDFEIENIRRFLNEYQDVTVQPFGEGILPGSKLIVKSGIMMGYEGTALRVNKKYVEVRIDSLGCKLVALVEKSKVEPVQ